MEKARIVVKRGTSQVEVEGSEEFVERTLPTLTELLPAHSRLDQSEGDEEAHLESDPESEESHEDDAANGGAGETQRQSMRKFVEEKKPQNASEAIAAVVYYMRKFRGKDEISGDEIRQALITARQRPPSNFAQALTDCRRRYGYVEVGTKKGLWKLSHDGEVTVELDLPRAA